MSSRSVSMARSSTGSKMGEQRERPLHELLSREMVDIYVGDENTHWILHEKLLCHRSKFFANIFYNKKGTKNTAYGLPDEDDKPFQMFVGWLYADSLPPITEEKQLAQMFDLYLMGEKWEIRKLIADCLESVRRWYHDTDTWPGLRRVQYIYANTKPESAMRHLLVSCVARMLVLGNARGAGSMPSHWENALRKNGQLATDIIMCVAKWQIQPETVPDTREESVMSMVDESEEMTEIKQEQQSEGGQDEGENGNQESEDESRS